MTTQKRNFVRWLMVVVLTVTLLTSTCLAVFAFAEEATPQTRDFNESFDRILDDCRGTGYQPAYRQIAWEAGKCDDVKDPILKVGSPKISAGFESLNIEVRSTDQSVKLADLKIGLRTADSDDIATANSWSLAHEDMEGGVTLSSGTDIGADWVTISIDFAGTEIKVNGASFDSTFPDAMLAFHLYAADNTKAGKLDVRKVSVTTGKTETVVLNFDTVNETWWYGGEEDTFVDIPACYAITDSKEIASDVATSNNLDEAYSAIVLKIAGSGSVTVAPIGEDGTVGTAKAWADLTDLAGTSVAALDGTFRNAVVSLESLGATKIKGVKVAVTGGTVYVAGAFFSNLEEPVLDAYFPVLDLDSIAYMSQFNFEYLKAGSDYDKAVADCATFNCDYILSYSTKNNVITNGHLVMDAQGEAFTSIKIRSKVASEGRNYLVLKYKLQNGATLDNFRFDVLKTEGDTGVKVVYANDLLAGAGLKSVSAANPYTGTNGYNYLVVDLEKTFGERYISGLDVYYSGEGQVLIDEVFYAHPVVPEATYGENILAEPKVLEVADGQATVYAYLGKIADEAKAHDGMEIVMRGSEGYTLDNVRIEMAGSTIWFAQNDAGTFHDVYGRTMPALTTENQTYTIDFANSGLSGTLGAIHVHGNAVEGGAKLTIESVRFIDYDYNLDYTEEVASNLETTATAADWAYIGWINGSIGTGSKYMIMEVEGDISQLRLEFPEGVRWIAENDQGTLRDPHGALFATSGAQTLVIDLEKSGVTTLGGIHVHNTFAAVGDVLKIKSVKFAGTTEITGQVLADDFAKTVTADNTDYTYCGYINGAEGAGSNYMLLDVKGDLSNFRVEFAGNATCWVADNPQGTLRDVNGNLFSVGDKDTAQTLIIDLAKSGVTNLGAIHLHNTFAAVGDVLEINSVRFITLADPYKDIVLPINDDAAPEISSTLPETAELGSEITIGATATDNYGDDVTIAIEVLLGSEKVTVTNGKFTASQVGVYSVNVTAKDNKNNVATKTFSVTVTAPVEEEPKGLSGGAIAAISVGSAAVVAGIVVAIILIRKKTLGV